MVTHKGCHQALVGIIPGCHQHIMAEDWEQIDPIDVDVPDQPAK